MNLTIGEWLATALLLVCARPRTRPPLSLATKTWTTTAVGAMTLPTETFGHHVFRANGPPITTATGRGFHHGVGPGLTTLPGVTRRFTTAAGYLPAEIGAGCLGRSPSSLCMRTR